MTWECSTCSATPGSGATTRACRIRRAEDPDRPETVTTAQQRVLRGGGFFSAAPDLRSARRIGFHPQVPFDQGGFRVARTWR